MGDKGESKKRADEERQRATALSAKAQQVSKVSPLEQESIQRGAGLETSLAQGALQPQGFVDKARSSVEGLVQNLVKQAVEGPGGLMGQFAQRGLTTSGLLPEAGSRAAVQQAIGVSKLVLDRAQQNAQFLRGVTSDVQGRGQVARGREISGGLTGLGFENQGLSRGAQIDQFGAEQQIAQQQALGSLGARGLGSLGALALAGPTSGASLLAIPGLIAGQSSGSLGLTRDALKKGSNKSIFQQGADAINA